MENIINVFCSGIKESKIIKIHYKNIESNVSNTTSHLNIRITSKESIFNIPFDIYCVQKDGRYVFGPLKIPLDSEILPENLDFFKSELCKYLKYYLNNFDNKKMTVNEKADFDFRHNIYINAENNRYFAFYKKYMNGHLISTDNNCLHNLTHKYSSTKLLDDILKLKPNMLFYATILPILPLEITLYILRLPKDNLIDIFFYFKVYRMYHKISPRISYLCLNNIINRLKDTLNINLIDNFTNISYNYILGFNWSKYLKPKDVKYLEECDFMKKRYYFKILSGNLIYKNDTPVFNKLESNYVTDCFIIKTDRGVFINTLKIKVKDKYYFLPVYQYVKNNDKLLVDLSMLNHLDNFSIAIITYDGVLTNITEMFTYVKKTINLSYEIYVDINVKIYKFSKKCAIICSSSKKEDTDFYYFLVPFGENAKFIYAICSDFMEEINFL